MLSACGRTGHLSGSSFVGICNVSSKQVRGKNHNTDVYYQASAGILQILLNTCEGQHGKNDWHDAQPWFAAGVQK